MDLLDPLGEYQTREICGGTGYAHDSLHVDKTQSLTDVIANQDQVWFKQSPIFRTRRIIKFKTIRAPAVPYLENKRLVYVS